MRSSRFLSWCRSLVVGFSLIAPLVSLAQDQEPWWLQLHHRNVAVQSSVVRESGLSEHVLEVYYPGKQDTESLDDGDLWVVSKAGYNANARFREARAVGYWDIIPEEEWPADWVGADGEVVDPDVFGFGEVYGVVATYEVAAPGDPSVWTETHNGVYTVLLEPGQVTQYTKRFFEPAWVGTFRIAIGEPEPAAPEVAVNFEESYPFDAPIRFVVTYTDDFALDLESIDGNDLYLVPELGGVDLPFVGEFLHSSGVRLVDFEHSDDQRQAVATYEVVGALADFGFDQGNFPVLYPGQYTLHVQPRSVCDLDGWCVEGEALGVLEVTGDLPPVVVPEGKFSLSKERRGYRARLELDLDPGTVVTQWGEPTLEGDTFYVDLQLSSIPWPGAVPVDGAAPPWDAFGIPFADFWGGNVFSYWLGVLSPGDYEMVARVGDEQVAKASFTAEAIDPTAIEVPDGHIHVEEEAGGYVAYLELGIDGETWVKDWGKPRLEDGSTYRIDIDLALFTEEDFDPDLFGLGNDDWEPFLEPFRRYDLGQPAPGGYTVAVYFRDSLVASTEFETRDSDAIRARLISEPITEATSDPHTFTISWVAGPDPNIDHLKTADVLVTRAESQFSTRAELIDVAVAESLPPQVMIRYAVDGPGGDWGEGDNGVYEVAYTLVPEGVDPAVVRLAPTPVGQFLVLIGDPNLIGPIGIDPDTGEVIDPTDGLSSPPKGADGAGDKERFSGGAFGEWLGLMLPGGLEASFELASGDPDGDGLTNWEEYAYGTLPLDPLSHSRPVPEVVEVDGAEHLALQFQRSAVEDVQHKVYLSNDLEHWVMATDEHLEWETVDDAAGNHQIRACLKENMDSSQFRYMRLFLEPLE